MTSEELVNAARTADKFVLGGAGGAVIGGLSVNEFVAFAGLAVAFVGMVISSYCKLRANARWKKEHELIMAERRARIAAIQRGEAVPPNPADAQYVELDE